MLLSQAGFNLGVSRSPIVPVYMSDSNALRNIAEKLYDNNIFPAVKTYPDVRADEGRLIFIVSAMHTKEQIEKTADMLRVLAKKYIPVCSYYGLSN